MNFNLTAKMLRGRLLLALLLTVFLSFLPVVRGGDGTDELRFADETVVSIDEPAAPEKMASTASPQTVSASKAKTAESEKTEKNGVTPEDALRQLAAGNARYMGQATDAADSIKRPETSEKTFPLATVFYSKDLTPSADLLLDLPKETLYTVPVRAGVFTSEELDDLDYGIVNLQTPLAVVMTQYPSKDVLRVLKEYDRLKGMAEKATAEIGDNPSLSVKNTKPEDDDLYLYSLVGSAVARSKKAYPDKDDEELANVIVETIAWQSVETILMQSSAARKLVASGDLNVIAAMVDDSTGQVYWLGPHPLQDEFLKAPPKDVKAKKEKAADALEAAGKAEDGKAAAPEAAAAEELSKPLTGSQVTSYQKNWSSSNCCTVVNQYYVSYPIIEPCWYLFYPHVWAYRPWYGAYISYYVPYPYYDPWWYAGWGPYYPCYCHALGCCIGFGIRAAFHVYDDFHPFDPWWDRDWCHHPWDLPDWDRPGPWDPHGPDPWDPHGPDPWDPWDPEPGPGPHPWDPDDPGHGPHPWDHDEPGDGPHPWDHDEPGDGPHPWDHDEPGDGPHPWDHDEPGDGPRPWDHDESGEHEPGDFGPGEREPGGFEPESGPGFDGGGDFGGGDFDGGGDFGGGDFDGGGDFGGGDFDGGGDFGGFESKPGFGSDSKPEHGAGSDSVPNAGAGSGLNPVSDPASKSDAGPGLISDPGMKANLGADSVSGSGPQSSSGLSPVSDSGPKASTGIDSVSGPRSGSRLGVNNSGWQPGNVGRSINEQGGVSLTQSGNSGRTELGGTRLGSQSSAGSRTMSVQRPATGGINSTAGTIPSAASRSSVGSTGSVPSIGGRSSVGSTGSVPSIGGRSSLGGMNSSPSMGSGFRSAPSMGGHSPMGGMGGGRAPMGGMGGGPRGGGPRR